MNQRFSIIALALILLLGSHSTSWATNAQQLFQAAVIKESGERDLDAAIALYQQVIDQSDSDHLLKLQAQLRIADCEERLGKKKEALKVYRQIIQAVTPAPTDIAREAQTNLSRLEAEERLVQQSSETAKTGSVVRVQRRYQPTRASISIGTDALFADSNTMQKLALSVRYRLSADRQHFPWYVEFSAVAPVGGSSIDNKVVSPNAQVMDASSLRLRYQMALSLSGELPHGRQRIVIPEAGAGIALTNSTINVATSFTGTGYPYYSSFLLTKSSWNPYFDAGLHFYPDHVISFMVLGTYTASPFMDSVQLQNPPHVASFDFPSSLWSLILKAQIKIGWPRVVK